MPTKLYHNQLLGRFICDPNKMCISTPRLPEISRSHIFQEWTRISGKFTFYYVSYEPSTLSNDKGCTGSGKIWKYLNVFGWNSGWSGLGARFSKHRHVNWKKIEHAIWWRDVSTSQITVSRKRYNGRYEVYSTIYSHHSVHCTSPLDLMWHCSVRSTFLPPLPHSNILVIMILHVAVDTVTSSNIRHHRGLFRNGPTQRLNITRWFLRGGPT